MFPNKRSTISLWKDETLVGLIHKFWIDNFTTADMLHALQRHGYHITSTQLKNIRLHPTIRLCHQRPLSISKDEIATQLETILSQHCDSGQSLRWGRSYLMGIVRKSGFFVSE